MTRGVLLRVFLFALWGMSAVVFVTGCHHKIIELNRSDIVTGQNHVPAKVDVVIIGGGLSGLATAYYLKKEGISYHILEIAPRLGGRVRTVTYEKNGEKISVDSGMEEYWVSNPAVALLKELKLPLHGGVGYSALILDGTLRPFTEDNSETFHRSFLSNAEFTAFQKLKAKISSYYADPHHIHPKHMGLKEISFSQWMEQQKLPHKVSELVRISLECEIGTEWDKISALDGLAEMHIFISGPKYDAEECFRVDGGNETFTDAMGTAIGEDHISLNRRVNSIVREGNRSLVHYLDTTTNQHGVIEAAHVVSTIPLFRLFELQFEPPLSAKKWQAIQSQKWGSYFKAHVFVPAKMAALWTHKDDSVLPILSDSPLGVIYDGNPRYKGPTKVLSLLITGRHAEAFNLMPLDQVRIILKQEFDKLWPGLSKEILDIEFYRFHPRAIAAWPVGRSRFDDLSQEIRRPENGVYLAGDFTESSHSDGAFLSAARVTRQILETKTK